MKTSRAMPQIGEATEERCQGDRAPLNVTRRHLMAGSLALAAATQVPLLRAASLDSFSPGPLKLWYRAPAQEWVQALPVGNGRLGAMVFGGVAHERLQLNEDTFFS